MAGWNPGRDPFPAGEIKAITDFEYLDELKLVRHAKVHVKKAPRGLYTDLSSVPDALWSVVGPIGPHLEASIIHDYLYMAWTDFRAKAVPRDWNFTDTVFLAGLKASKVKQRDLIHTIVHSPIGWRVFRRKSYTLKERMDEWLPHLAAGHGRDG